MRNRLDGYASSRYASLFYDNGGVTAPRPARDMTLTYALIADGGIVLAADSEVTYSHGTVRDDHGTAFVVGTYRSEKHKIRTLRNGSAFSIAGNAGLLDMLLTRADLEGIDDSKPFEEVYREYSRLFRDEYWKDYEEIAEANRPRCVFLFCGYIGKNGKKAPRIVSLDSCDSFDPKHRSGFGFTGRENHGAALFLHHRLYSEGMPMDSAKCLAYCALSEVADWDNMVGRPIEMVIITESGVEQFTDFARYERKRKEVTAKLFDLLHPKQP